MRELANQGLGIIMISSDLPEIIGMSDRILVMRGQGIQHEFGPGEAVSEETILAYAAGANRG
jgi:ribose transport system ATP-binding protein